MNNLTKELMNELLESTCVVLLTDFSFQYSQYICLVSTSVGPISFSQKDPGFCKPSGKNVRVLAGWDLYTRPFCFPFLSFPSINLLSPLVPVFLVFVAN